MTSSGRARAAAATRRGELAVGIVFDQRHAPAPREHHQPVAPLLAQRDAGRVVQRRHRVDEARPARAQDRLDVIDAHAVSSTGTGIARSPWIWKICSAPGYVGASTTISSPGSASDCATSVMPLRRAGQHQHVARVDRAAARAHALGDRFAQRRVALRCRRRSGRVDVAADARERRRKVVQRRRFGRRHALNERDLLAVLGGGQARPARPGTAPTRQGGSVTHHGTPAARSGAAVAQRARPASPTRPAARSARRRRARGSRGRSCSNG
jgi:hypothetical protein